MKKQSLYKGFLFLLLFSCSFSYLKAQEFIHPGILHKESDMARMRQKIAEKAEPWFTAWNNLRSSPEAQLTWNPRPTETVIRGGTGDNIALMYRDVAASYAHALIYAITGDKAHGDKAAQILNAWSSINKYVSGNADRYLAAGLNGYQFANAAELMRGYPEFNSDRFKSYLMNVFYYPMNERFLIGNAWGAPHNDACATNYRVNWDACNMNAMLAISIFCDYKEGFDKALNYSRNGDGTGNINRAVNFIHSPVWGQWEESGRDQGHTMGGLMLYAVFCEIAWNQGVDFYGYGDSRFRKGAEYVARYNIMENGVGKYEDLPYTSYSRQMGSTCSWYTEPTLSPSVRGKYGTMWEMIYNHYARRTNQGDKVKSIYEILQQQPSLHVPSVAAHPDTYDHPAVATLTFFTDSGSSVLPWTNMDVMPQSIVKLAHYGQTVLSDSILSVTASGEGIKSTADHFQFVFQRLIDEGSIVTKLNSLEEINDKCQAGVILRENAGQNSPFVMLSLSASNGIVFVSRDSAGKTVNTISTDASENTFPLWLKISRTENEFMAMISNNGIDWSEKGRTSIALNRDLLAGVAASSNDLTATTTAVFEKTRILQGNIKPMLKMTSPLIPGTEYIAPANITIAGTAYDMDGAIDRTEIYINDSLYFTVRISPFTYQFKNAETGTYRLTIKAYDTAGAMSQTAEQQIKVSKKTEKLPWYKFDETKQSYSSADASGHNLNAILFGGSTFSEGRIENGLKLDGTDDYARLPATFIHQLSEFSISTWVRLDELKTWVRIFDFGQGTDAYMMLTANNGTGITFELKSGISTQKVVTTQKPSINTWNFYTVTLTDNALSIYLNGKLTGKSTNFTLRPYDIGASFNNFIGKSQWATDPFLKGTVDEFRFFNNALTVDEINNLMLGQTSVDNFSGNDMKLYPNPTREKVFLKNAEGCKLSIFDATGRLIRERKITENIHSENLSGFQTGYYLIQIGTPEGKIIQEKLIAR